MYSECNRLGATCQLLLHVVVRVVYELLRGCVLCVCGLIFVIANTSSPI